LGGYEYRQLSDDQLENELTSSYSVLNRDKIAALEGYDYLLTKEAFTDTLSVDTVAGYSVKQGYSFEADTMILNIGKTEFVFCAKDLAKQLMKQAEKLKPYEDKTTPRGLDKRYLLPQKMLQLTQVKSGITVMTQVQDMSFDYTKKDGIRIYSVLANYFIKIEK